MTLGIAVNMAGERYSLDKVWFQINQYLYAVSAITHLNKQFDGFYLRTDLGLANFVITDSDSNSETTDTGYGILVGVGYSFNLFTNFRMAPYVNYKYSKVEDSDDSKIALGVKFIF
jgi:predicted porin